MAAERAADPRAEVEAAYRSHGDLVLRRARQILADDASGAFTFTKDATIDLAPGRVVVIDFDPAKGGFVFHG